MRKKLYKMIAFRFPKISLLAVVFYVPLRAELVEINRVMAKVEDRIVTRGEIDKAMNLLNFTDAEKGDRSKEFVDGNEAKLLQLYEDYMGPFYKKVSHGPLDPRTEMPASYLAQGALTQIYELVEGDKTIQDLMDESPLRPLITCATLKQLHRSHAIQID